MRRTTLAYIEQNDAYLMLLRVKKEQDLNAGKWIGVGGKFEEGEGPDECMKREVFEETGLSVTDYRFEGLVHFISAKYETEEMYLYTIQGFDGEVNYECNEGILKWIPKEEVLQLNLWEGDHYFLEKLLNRVCDKDSSDKHPNTIPFHMTLAYDTENRLVAVRTLEDTPAPETSSVITCPHGFSNRLGGVSRGIFFSCNLGLNRDDNENDVTENWDRFFTALDTKANLTHPVSFVRGKQVHGNIVHIATKKDARPCYGAGVSLEADGYVTAESNLPLAIFTADCVPVLLQDPNAHIIGALHCGWKPTVADLEGEAIKTMISLGAQPANIRAAIGPAIEQCCFEVGPEVVEACTKLLSGGTTDSVTSTSEAFPFIKPSFRDGHFLLDLKGVVRARLLQLGITPEHIEMAGECTMCHPEKYYSHRYVTGQNRGSIAGVIWQ